MTQSRGVSLHERVVTTIFVAYLQHTFAPKLRRRTCSAALKRPQAKWHAFSASNVITNTATAAWSQRKWPDMAAFALSISVSGPD